MPREARPFRRRALSITPLTDVIFLLLLYFILSSTFLRFGELELTAATGGGATAAPDAQVLFLQLSPEVLALNGSPTDLTALPDILAGLLPEGAPGTAVVALRDGVDAQTLTNLLVVLRRVPDLTVTVIG